MNRQERTTLGLADAGFERHTVNMVTLFNRTFSDYELSVLFGDQEPTEQGVQAIREVLKERGPISSTAITVALACLPHKCPFRYGWLIYKELFG